MKIMYISVQCPGSTYSLFRSMLFSANFRATNNFFLYLQYSSIRYVSYTFGARSHALPWPALASHGRSLELNTL